jgi:hypothetical protein
MSNKRLDLEPKFVTWRNGHLAKSAGQKINLREHHSGPFGQLMFWLTF